MDTIKKKMETNSLVINYLMNNTLLNKSFNKL